MKSIVESLAVFLSENIERVTVNMERSNIVLRNRAELQFVIAERKVFPLLVGIDIASGRHTKHAEKSQMQRGGKVISAIEPQSEKRIADFIVARVEIRVVQIMKIKSDIKRRKNAEVDSYCFTTGAIVLCDPLLPADSRATTPSGSVATVSVGGMPAMTTAAGPAANKISAVSTALIRIFMVWSGTTTYSEDRVLGYLFLYSIDEFLERVGIIDGKIGHDLPVNLDSRRIHSRDQPAVRNTVDALRH